MNRDGNPEIGEVCMNNGEYCRWDGEDFEPFSDEEKEIKAAWGLYQIAREALNNAVRAHFKCGDPVLVFWNKQWRKAVVSWVPYPNGPAASHIYVMIPGHKQSKAYHIGGGLFEDVRHDR